MDRLPVVIVGGGLAGLNCARLLRERSVDFLLLEASDGLGGRVRTDTVDRFRLDRGFQVFQTAYPEARTALDYEKLRLVELEPGAVVRRGGKWHRMVDPLRRPSQAFGTLFNGIGTLSDRIKLLRLRRDVSRGDIQQLLQRAADTSTLELLSEEYRFSDDFIDQFFRPWLSGIFLESQLSTSANYFRFVFRMLSAGPISYPRAGIQALADNLAGSLDPAQVRLGTRVESIRESQVSLASGETIAARRIVLATDATASLKLLGSEQPQPKWNGTICAYFSSDQKPTDEKCLMLNGDQGGVVNHLFILTNTVPSLAPDGKTLISVSSVGCAQDNDSSFLDQIYAEMGRWFGPSVKHWRHLRTYSIPQAVPFQQPGAYAASNKSFDDDSPIVCGDFTETSSVHGALRSGRLAAEQILSQS